MASKSKQNLSDSPNTKVSPTSGAGRVNRIAKLATSSPSLQNSRLSLDRSPKSVNSASPKTPTDRRSPKITTPPEKQQSRTLKGSELQSRLDLAEEDLKKANEKLSILEKEKLQAMQELKEAQKLADEANEKLTEALSAQRRAEEASEIEKFRAVEIEQAGIEEAEKKEKEWQKELEALKEQHNLDVHLLQSAEEDLEVVKEELVMISDAKKDALQRADEATWVAEIQSEKVEILSAEITHLNTLLNSSVAMETSEKKRIEVEMNLQRESLQQQLHEAKTFQQKLIEGESYITELHSQLEHSRISESNSQQSLLESYKKIKELEKHIETTSESFDSVMNKLESKNEELHNAQIDVAYLKGKIEVLEECLAEKDDELVNSHSLLHAADEEASEYYNSFMSEINSKNEALGNTETAIASLKDKIDLLETCIVEKEGEIVKSHSLLRAAKEEASENHNSFMDQIYSKDEELHSTQTEIASLKDMVNHLETYVTEKEDEVVKSDSLLRTAKGEVSDLTKLVELLTSELESVKEEKSTIEKQSSYIIQKLTEEKNKLITHLENSKEEGERSKKELESLASALRDICSESGEAKEALEKSKSRIEELEVEIQNYKTTLQEFAKERTEWEQRAKDLMGKIKDSEKETSSMGKEISNLLNLLKAAEAESRAAKEELDRMKNNMKKTESDMVFFKESIESEKSENTRLMTALLQKDKQLQNVVQENKELRVRENSTQMHAEELAKLLEEAKSKTEIDADRDYDLLSKMEFSHLPHQNSDGSGMGESKIPRLEKKQDDDSGDVDLKMWESCKIGDKDFSPEREQKMALNSEEDRLERSSLTGDMYGSDNPSGKLLEHKKKKPFLQKFGSLLKKRGAANQKP